MAFLFDGEPGGLDTQSQHPRARAVPSTSMPSPVPHHHAWATSPPLESRGQAARAPPRPVALRLALPPASPAARRQELQPPSSPRPPYSDPGDPTGSGSGPSQGGRPAPSSRAALLGAGSAPGPAPSTFWSGRLGGSSAGALRAQVEGWPGRQGQPAGLGGAGPLTWPFPAWVPAAPPSCPGEGLKSWPTRNTPPRSFFCPQE